MNAGMTDAASLTYSQRSKPFAREVIFRLEPQVLFVDTGKKDERIPYGEIASVRLVYEPKNITSGFRTTLTLKTGRTVSFTNLDWKSYLEYERRDAAYRDFVTELTARAARANPALACIAGRPPVLWALTAALGFVTLGGMAFALAWAASQGFWSYAALAAVFLVPFTFQVHGLVLRNKPASFSPPSPPLRLMPVAKG